MERGHGDCVREEEVYHEGDAHQRFGRRVNDQDDVILYLEEAPPLLLYPCYFIMGIYMAFIAYLTAVLIKCAMGECA